MFHVGLVIHSVISTLLRKNEKALAFGRFSCFIFTCCRGITIMLGRRKEEDASNACSGEMQLVSEIERDCNVLFCNSYLFIVAVWTFRGEPVVCMKYHEFLTLIVCFHANMV